MSDSEPHARAAQRFSPLAWVAQVSARRAWTVVIVSAVVLALGGVSLSRLHVSASMEAMLGSHSAAAEAFHRAITDFQAGEALLVLVEPQGVDRGSAATPKDREATARFADDLVNALVNDPRSRDFVAWARSRQDEAIIRFAATRIIPSGPYYLGEAGTRELLARFEPLRLREQFSRNESLAASPGPAGGALSKNVLRDPLRLFELAAVAGIGAFDASATPEFGSTPPPEVSSDGHAVLVRIASRTSMNDLEAARTLAALVREIALELNATQEARTGPKMDVRLGGAYAISAVASGTIKRDSIVSTLLSVGLLYALFVVFYRKWLTPILIGVVAGAGMVVGFGVHAIGGPTISPLAAAVAAVLAGLGVDYGIHFVSHFDALRAQGRTAQECATETAREMALPITTNCFTSIFGFASLWPSKIAMLSDFAKLGTAGLIGAWIAAFTLLPALLVLTHRRADRSQAAPPRFGVVADVVARRPRLWVGLSLSLLVIVGVAGAVPGIGPRLEGDLTVLHPRPNEALATTDEIIARFAGQGELIPVLVRVQSPQDLLPAAIDAATALNSEACRRVGVVDVIGMHRLLPDPRKVEGVRALLSGVNVGGLLSNFDAAVEASAFEPAAFAGYRDFVGRLLAGKDPPTIGDLEQFPTIAQRVLPIADAPALRQSETLLVVRLSSPLRDRERRGEVVAALRTALVAVPQATLAGLLAVSTELEDATRQGLPQSIMISVSLVLAWLIIVFRRPMDVLLALVPLLFAGTFTVALMMATGTRFNPINSIAIPLLDGIAVDAGVFLVAIARQARREGVDRAGLVVRLRPTMHAVLLASATTITGFASLCVTHTPAIRSLGFVAAVGIGASFCGAAGVLVPWLLRRAHKP
ncbi:MAG: MMPL family transporter [Planctomycetota bacterium]